MKKLKVILSFVMIRISDMAYINILFSDRTYQIPSVLMTGFSGITGQIVSYNNGSVTYSFE